MKFSIITPSFNQLPFLQQTAKSILAQQGDFDLEWIVQDAASTDGSVAYLDSIKDDRLRFISQEDAGQSDAINRGLARATGDIIGWLNSDDLYCDKSLAVVADAFTANPTARWLVGRYEIINQQGTPVRPRIVRYKRKQLERYTYRALLRENFIPQPAVFWRRDFGTQAGLLDVDLKFTMDYDLWLRFGWVCDPLVIDATLAQFRVHDASKTGVINRAQFDEGYAVAKRYAGEDRAILRAHRRSVEKIVLAYRLMRLLKLG